MKFYRQCALARRKDPEKFAAALDNIIDNYMENKTSNGYTEKLEKTQKCFVDLMRKAPEHIQLIGNKLNKLAEKTNYYELECDVDLSNLGLKKLPDLSCFEMYGNYFCCSDNELTDLKGVPGIIGTARHYEGFEEFSYTYGSLQANDNKIKSLEGPLYVSVVCPQQVTRQ